MTDQQFQLFLAAQLAQVALLQAIEANVSFMAHKHVPSDRIHPNWKRARELVDLAQNQLAANAD